MNQREMTRKAFANAAALVDAMDLEQLYGPMDMSDADMERAEKGQREVVEWLERRSGEAAL